MGYIKYKKGKYSKASLVFIRRICQIFKVEVPQ